MCFLFITSRAHAPSASSHKTRVPPPPPAPADEAKYKIQVMSIGIALFTRYFAHTHTPPFALRICVYVLNVCAHHTDLIAYLESILPALKMAHCKAV
jgi:hypothetical protein